MGIQVTGLDCSSYKLGSTSAYKGLPIVSQHTSTSGKLSSACTNTRRMSVRICGSGVQIEQNTPP